MRATGRQIDAFIESAIKHDGDGCLLWPFGRQSAGYAHFGRGKKHKLVSRVVCETINGPPPVGKPYALHSCSNGHLGCVSGAHLRWGSQKENIKDAMDRGWSPRGSSRRTAKLTEQDAVFIKAHRLSLTPRQIAARLGVDRALVRHVLVGNSWKWVPDPLVAA